ncbi:hypothetical protein RJ639_031646 [Escallonia herrerae]|uniref:F-box domain-containing protein n=1 Tax=Escallonia herrerae TaxID=1293975 RepID=A0AA88X208_9ASTE|nr:hypothetical protein RJ639_031646 [Escallonia herrerae]
METRIDFLHWLETDMSLNILMYLDDPSDLIRATSVSRFWRHFVIANRLCKQLCVKYFPQLAVVAGVVEPSSRKESVDIGSSTRMEWEVLERDHRAYTSLFQALKAFAVTDCIADAVSASSTDRYPDESIVNTLDPREKFLGGYSYWSSKGHSDPDVPESLIYRLNASFCIITEINIRPFLAYFQPGLPIYSAKSLRFRVGHLKSSTDVESDLVQFPTEQWVDDKFIWTYTSQEFPMAQQDNHLQKFKLPEPVLCIGGFLQIELLGRVQKQETDGLFYICVSHVQVMGQSLFPAFDVEILESSEMFLLKYYANAFYDALQGLSNGSPCATSSVAPVLPPEQGIWVDGLLDFFMHRNEPGAEPVEWLSDEDDEEWDPVVIH